MSASTSDQGDRSGSRWLSRGLEELICLLKDEQLQQPPFFDVVVVGSGYGGAMAASQLTSRYFPGSKEPLRVCVLERGREYLSGMFPSSEAELPGNVRFSSAEHPKPRGNQEGLLDVRIGPDVCALVACGLGGGSLINAGVMVETKIDAWPIGAWPSSLKLDGLTGYYKSAKQMLGVTVSGKENTIDLNARGLPRKFKALQKLQVGDFGAAPLSISMQASPNVFGVHQEACKQCGDCATGCNFNAKNSLDRNLLVDAYRRGAQIFTGATVTSLEKSPTQGWTLEVVHTDANLRGRVSDPLRLRAKFVILAAGTFGSTEILLRSASDNLQFSQLLGQKFSTNGDALAVAYKQKEAANALADESMDPDAKNNPPFGRNVGPTITGIIDRRNRSKELASIEEFAIPGPLRRLFSESFTLARCLNNLSKPDVSHHRPGREGNIDPLAINDDDLCKTQIFGLMGHDGAQGSLELIAPANDDDVSDGAIRVRWPQIREDSSDGFFDKQFAALRQLVHDSGQGGEVLPNPIWRALPEALDGILDTPKGPVLTVHPLGGCPMGEHVLTGVVDHLGRVFDPIAPGAFHYGLVVLDGSIIPTSLAINPALTIAAIALRAVDLLRNDWGMTDGNVKNKKTGQLPTYPRPEFKKRQPTQVEIMERLSGQLTLQDAQGQSVDRMVELTLKFRPVAISDLMRTLARHVDVEPADSKLRTFDLDTWAELNHFDGDEAMRDRLASGNYKVQGTLQIFNRETSTFAERKQRANSAYRWNRGVRDGWQWLWGMVRSDPRHLLTELCRRCKLSNFLASRAGEVRRLDYDLTLSEMRREDPLIGPANGQKILGHKRFTYGRRSNPWTQLQQVILEEFPAAKLTTTPASILALDVKFLAGKGVPLFRLSHQDNQATALFEIGSLLAYFARLLISIHSWSMRKPDAQSLREPQRLPQRLPGVTKPTVFELEVGRHADGTIARVRLTRYGRPMSTLSPLVMIHGYSASGTTFAHPAVRPGLAEYMWRQQRDVWVLDLRTSSGMPTAVLPWRFEQAAHEDIPAALTYIERFVTNERNKQVKAGSRVLNEEASKLKLKIDIIAHCMGSAMMTMAILGRPKPGDAYFAERNRLPSLIDNLILSQVAPTTVFSPANVFRAYAMGYLRNFLPLHDYQFRPTHEPTPMEQMADRLFSTMPYSDSTFDIENPITPWKKTPWVRTRHRMDALYARDFNVENIPQAVLDKIDDFFGPLNMDTVLNSINFARTSLITNHAGRNSFVKARRIYERWRNINTLCVNGGANGLADVSTIYRMTHLMTNAGVGVFRTFIKEGYGHQDCLIGRDAEDIFAQMHLFLSNPKQFESNPKISCPDWVPSDSGGGRVGAPWLGPVRGQNSSVASTLTFALAPDPQIGTPSHVVFAAVVKVNAQEGARFALCQSTRGQHLLSSDWTGYGFGLKSVDLSLPELGLATACQDYKIIPLFFYESREPADGVDANAQAAKKNKIRNAVEKFLHDVPIERLQSYVTYDAADATMEQAAAARASDNAVTFAIGSCQYPPGAFDKEIACSAFRRLQQLAAGVSTRPAFLVLMGDQIYSDATAGLFDPTASSDRYVLPYENWLQLDPVRDVLRQVPTFMMLDDHEIRDNWEPIAQSDIAHDNMLKHGRASYLTYQRANGPPILAKGTTQFPLWHCAMPGGLPFFFADSRTDRQVRTVEQIQHARMMGPDQFRELTDWLKTTYRDPTLPRFVVSSAILLPRKRRESGDLTNAIRSDSWQGYPATFHELLAHIADTGACNLVFLSGDEHQSCVASVAVQNMTNENAKPVLFHSIHCSGMYSPFPFANGKPADLFDSDCFEFEVGGNLYNCKVAITYAQPADGFATIQCVRGNNGWSIEFQLYRSMETGMPRKEDNRILESGVPEGDNCLHRP
jgi:choline dehydrogenase-like flavoprotein/pimeloyl-ACP methyl ester carboxylesterase